jgi:hypothetical protein
LRDLDPLRHLIGAGMPQIAVPLSASCSLRRLPLDGRGIAAIRVEASWEAGAEKRRDFGGSIPTFDVER